MNLKFDEAVLSAVATLKRIHQAQVDKANLPYWMHPARVMLRLGENAGVEERQAAVLHDAFEDTKVTESELLGQGVRPAAIETMHLLTRRRDETYDEFIARITRAGSISAMRIKLADLYDNSDEARLSLLETDSAKRLARRYHKAISRISNMLSAEQRAELISTRWDKSDFLIQGIQELQKI